MWLGAQSQVIWSHRNFRPLRNRTSGKSFGKWRKWVSFEIWRAQQHWSGLNHSVLPWTLTRKFSRQYWIPSQSTWASTRRIHKCRTGPKRPIDDYRLRHRLKLQIIGRNGFTEFRTTISRKFWSKIIRPIRQKRTKIAKIAKDAINQESVSKAHFNQIRWKGYESRCIKSDKIPPIAENEKIPTDEYDRVYSCSEQYHRVFRPWAGPLFQPCAPDHAASKTFDRWWANAVFPWYHRSLEPQTSLDYKQRLSSLLNRSLSQIERNFHSKVQHRQTNIKSSGISPEAARRGLNA